jgi:DNA-directed RNA polymerase specialized sigma24 family protein
MITPECKDKLAKEHFHLIERYAKHFRKYTPDTELEEIVGQCQEAMAIALNLHDPDRGAFAPFFFQVARGVVWRYSKYEHARKRIPKNIVTSLDVEVQTSEDECFNLHELVPDVTSMDDFDMIEWKQTLVQSIAQLYDETTIEIINYILLGYSLADIAHIYGIDKMTCYNRWYKALDVLRKVMKDSVGKYRIHYPVKRKW